MTCFFSNRNTSLDNVLSHVSGVTVFLGANVETIASDLQTDLTTILAVWLVLVLLLMRAARDLNDRFSVLLCVGAAAMIFFHVLVNIGMVTGMLPVVGMTLPFISYGGSSMLTMIMAIALAVNAATWRRS